MALGAAENENNGHGGAMARDENKTGKRAAKAPSGRMKQSGRGRVEEKLAPPRQVVVNGRTITVPGLRYLDDPDGTERLEAHTPLRRR